MSIDTLNAYCWTSLVLFQCLSQGRLNKHPDVFLALRCLLQPPFCEHTFKILGLAQPDALVTLGIRSWVALADGVYGWTCLELVLMGAGNQLLTSRPELKQDYPPNLSILISGGKENNCDALSNGE